MRNGVLVKYAPPLQLYFPLAVAVKYIRVVSGIIIWNVALSWDHLLINGCSIYSIIAFVLHPGSLLLAIPSSFILATEAAFATHM